MKREGSNEVFTANLNDLIVDERDKFKDKSLLDNSILTPKIIIEEKYEKETIKVPNIHKRKKSFFSSLFDFDNDTDNSLTLSYNSLNLIRANCELNFDSDFCYETISMDLYTGLFSSTSVKIRLDYCKIVCSDLKENHLKMNNREIVLKPLLCLDFNQVTAKVYINKQKKEFKIAVLGCSKEFVFRAKSDGVLDSFLIYLNYYISISKGAKENLVGVSLREDFYKVNNNV